MYYSMFSTGVKMMCASLKFLHSFPLSPLGNANLKTKHERLSSEIPWPLYNFIVRYRVCILTFAVLCRQALHQNCLSGWLHLHAYQCSMHNLVIWGKQNIIHNHMCHSVFNAITSIKTIHDGSIKWLAAMEPLFTCGSSGHNQRSGTIFEWREAEEPKPLAWQL